MDNIIQIKLVRLLKERTGLPLLRCKQLLELHGWDMDKAIRAARAEQQANNPGIMDGGEAGKKYWESHIPMEKDE